MGLGPNSHVTGEGAAAPGRRWLLCLPWVVADGRGSSAGVLAPLPPTLPPNSPVLVAAVLVFCLHGECDFSCSALASKVPPSLFPSASSVAHHLSQFLHYVQPWKGLLDLKQYLTLLALCTEVCRKTAWLFILFVFLAFGN